MEIRDFSMDISSDNEECKKAHNRVDGSVSKKIINFTNKPVLSRQIRVSYAAKWI